MTNKEQELVKKCLSYSKDPIYWKPALIQKYLRKLKEKTSKIAIHSRPAEIREHIEDWIKAGDKDLKIFHEFQFLFEKERKKSVELLSLDEDLKEKINKRIGSLKPLPYDPLKVGTRENPEIIYLERSPSKIEVWFSIKMEKPLSKTIQAKELSPETKKEIQGLLQDTGVDINKIKTIRCDYSSFQRIINSITIDLEKDKLQITTDEPKLIDPDDDEENIIKPENRFSEILSKGLSALEISSTLESIEAIRENKRINKETAKNIRALEKDKILIIPFVFEFDYEKGDISEKNNNKFYKFTTPRLKISASSYFNKKGTFKDFFSENPDLDAEAHGSVLKIVKTIEGIERTAEGFFIFIVNENAEITSGRVQCNVVEGHLRLILEQGSMSYDQVNEELDKIFS